MQKKNRQVPQQWIEKLLPCPRRIMWQHRAGESLDDVEKRTRDFMEDICSRKELQDKTILVSTHGCALRRTAQQHKRKQPGRLLAWRRIKKLCRVDCNL